jgi:hypothetical protein
MEYLYKQSYNKYEGIFNLLYAMNYVESVINIYEKIIPGDRTPLKVIQSVKNYLRAPSNQTFNSVRASYYEAETAANKIVSNDNKLIAASHIAHSAASVALIAMYVHNNQLEYTFDEAGNVKQHIENASKLLNIPVNESEILSKTQQDVSKYYTPEQFELDFNYKPQQLDLFNKETNIKSWRNLSKLNNGITINSWRKLSQIYSKEDNKNRLITIIDDLIKIMNKNKNEKEYMTLLSQLKIIQNAIITNNRSLLQINIKTVDSNNKFILLVQSVMKDVLKAANLLLSDSSNIEITDAINKIYSSDYNYLYKILDTYNKIQRGELARNRFFFLDDNSKDTIALLAVVYEINKLGDWIRRTYYIEDFRRKNETGYTLSFNTFSISITSTKDGSMFFYKIDKDDFDSNSSTYLTTGKRVDSIESLVNMAVKEVKKQFGIS